MIVKKDVGEDQQQKIRYASLLSNADMDFILTLNRENGAWDETKASPRNSNGTRDYGVCQLNNAYHKDFINSAEFKDWKKQIDYCWSLYSGYKARGIIGKRFYGFNTRLKDRDKFFFSTITP